MTLTKTGNGRDGNGYEGRYLLLSRCFGGRTIRASVEEDFPRAVGLSYPCESKGADLHSCFIENGTAGESQVASGVCYDALGLRKRLRSRHGHFMNMALLQSQFDDLEQPQRDENVLTIELGRTSEDIVERIKAKLNLAGSG